VQAALERTVFVFSEPVEAAPAPLPEPVESTVAFSGSATGIVVISASEGFARQVAAGFLSVEPEEVDPVTQGQDAINEMSNIVAGLVIRSLGGETSSIKLGLPQVGRKAPQTAASTTVTVDSVGDLLRVDLYVASKAA
jgi:CheY-specific phosphatase CheX